MDSMAIVVFAFGICCFLVGYCLRLIQIWLFKSKRPDLHVVAYTGPSMVAYNCDSYRTALLRAAKIIRSERADGHQLKQLDIDTPLWRDQHGHQVSVISIDSSRKQQYDNNRTVIPRSIQ